MQISSELDAEAAYFCRQVWT